MSSTSAGRKSRRAAPPVLLASVSLLVVGGVTLSAAASAAFLDAPATGSPGRLVLSSDPYPAEFTLSPGDPAYWQVRARLEDATEATLQLELRKSGELVEHPRGLTMIVDSCTQDWVEQDAGAPACTAGSERVTVATPDDDYVDDSPSFELAALETGAPRYLLITLELDGSPTAGADESLMGLTGDMAVGLTATAIDEVPVTPPGTPPTRPEGLPATGADVTYLWATAALAAGLLGLGIALRLSRKGTAR